MLAHIFSDGMVFQANMPVRIFGTGDGAIEIEFLGRSYHKQSDGAKWVMELEAHDYGGPYCMEIVLDGERKCLKDIMFGDVLLCAGQSNMQFEIGLESGHETAAPNEHIRYFFSDNIEENSRLRSAMGWLPATEGNVCDFSALAYHVAEGIVRDKGVCVGLIACVQGASAIRSWLSEDVLTPEVYLPVEQRHSDSSDPAYARFNQDSACYKKTFLPIAPYTVSTVIWYQGESDTSVAEGTLYLQLLKKLVWLWRQELMNEALPFLVVQICDFDTRADEGWRVIQRAQERAQSEIARVRVVTSSDVCEHTEIHPADKRGLAEKIGRWCRENSVMFFVKNHDFDRKQKNSPYHFKSEIISMYTRF